MSAPQQKPCSHCGKPFVVDDTWCEIGGKLLHLECLEANVKSLAESESKRILGKPKTPTG